MLLRNPIFTAYNTGHVRKLLKDTPILLSCYGQNHRDCNSHRTHNRRSMGMFKSMELSEWSKAITEAERIVGYPTSFMTLRCLLSDELSNVALQMRRLVGTKHPLLKTARRFVYGESSNVQTRGLVILLISKTAGQGPDKNKDEEGVIEKMVDGIYPRQRSLAEIVEMIHTAYLVHRGVVNLKEEDRLKDRTEDLEFGNKMAVLTGDFLLATASTSLSKLYDTKVVNIISRAIKDLMCAEFTDFRDSEDNVCVPNGATLEDWKQQEYLMSGSLLSKSCSAAMLLGNHSADIQETASDFGYHMALSQQLHKDITSIIKPNDRTSIEVASAPIVQHLHLNKQDELKCLLKNIEKNGPKIKSLLENSGALEESMTLCKQHGNLALESLSKFKSSEARTALQNMVKATTTL